MSRKQQGVTDNLTVSFDPHPDPERGKICNHEGDDETYYWNRWNRKIMAVPFNTS